MRAWMRPVGRQRLAGVESIDSTLTESSRVEPERRGCWALPVILSRGYLTDTRAFPRRWPFGWKRRDGPVPSSGCVGKPHGILSRRVGTKTASRSSDTSRNRRSDLWQIEGASQKDAPRWSAKLEVPCSSLRVLGIHLGTVRVDGPVLTGSCVLGCVHRVDGGLRAERTEDCGIRHMVRSNQDCLRWP